MTVCTDELALRDLTKDEPATVTPDERAHLAELRRAWEVIPGHGGMVEDSATVSAGNVLLQRSIPLDEALVVQLLLQQPTLSRARVVRPIVFPTAVLAPRLATVSVPSMELLKRLLEPAAPALLHCQIRLQTVADGANRTDMAGSDKPAR
jgi:hypothetical protein